jgi:uncharacterized membrane protein SpoIIM required for sporulation
MISSRWLRNRQPYWSRLESLVRRADRVGVRAGISTLTHQELQELGLLYRQTASDLATVREDHASRQLATFLNRLLGRSHNLIYRGQGPSPRGIVRFYTETFPQTFRATARLTLLAFIVFLLGALPGFLVTLRDPAFPRYLLGPQMMDTIERRQMWTESIVAIKPLAASGIMTNNLSVSFLTFASGVFAGLGTLYFLLFNGVLIGVVGGACWQAGLSLGLWSFVAPHGVLELPAIFIAGGAGLLLGRGLLFPGLLPRRQSLARAGEEAVRLVLGIVPVLVVAGVIEAFISPSHIPAGLKFLLAAGNAALFTLYLTQAGRGAKAGSAP